MNPEPQYFTMDRIVRIVIALGALVGAYFLLTQLSSVLIPFFLAWLVAYLMNPVVELFTRWTKRRTLSVVLTLLCVVLIVGGLLLLLVPVMIDELTLLNDLLSKQMANFKMPTWVPHDLADQAEGYISDVDYEALLQQEGIGDKIMSVGKSLWDAMAGVFGVIGALFGIVTFLLYLVFILLDYDDISDGWQDYVPLRYKPFTLTLVDDLTAGMNGYFRAQSKIVLIVAVLFAIGFKIIGLPFGIVLGLFIGLLNYVPYLQMAGLVPAIGLAGLHALETGQSFWFVAGMVVLVFAFVQIIQEAILTPRIMGDLTGMNPALVLLSLSVWGSLLGIMGMIIGIPLTMLLLSYYDRYIIASKKKGSAKK